MTTLTITRTPTGYTYAGTEHRRLWDATRAVSAELWPGLTYAEHDAELRWLYRALLDRRQAWVGGRRIEVAE